MSSAKFTASVCGQFVKIEKFPPYNNNRPDYSPEKRD